LPLQSRESPRYPCLVTFIGISPRELTDSTFSPGNFFPTTSPVNPSRLGLLAWCLSALFRCAEPFNCVVFDYFGRTLTAPLVVSLVGFAFDIHYNIFISQDHLGIFQGRRIQKLDSWKCFQSTQEADSERSCSPTQIRGLCKTSQPVALLAIWKRAWKIKEKESGTTG
jgi:hypothetical protein